MPTTKNTEMETVHDTLGCVGRYLYVEQGGLERSVLCLPGHDDHAILLRELSWLRRYSSRPQTNGSRWRRIVERSRGPLLGR